MEAVTSLDYVVKEVKGRKERDEWSEKGSLKAIPMGIHLFFNIFAEEFINKIIRLYLCKVSN